MDNKNYKKKLTTRQLVIIASLGGISIFLSLTGLGFIPLPFFKLTIMHVPVIIGALLEGPIVGAIIGLIFGLFSMYQNFTAPTPLSFIFWNPIIALIPRILIGVVSYYAYALFKKIFKNINISIGLSAIIGSLVNTIGVLGLTYVFYLERYAVAKEIATEAVALTLLGTVTLNGIPEAIFAALISIPIVRTINKLMKK